MKNIEASVGAVPAQEKKEEDAKIEEEEYTEHENEMYSFLGDEEEEYTEHENEMYFFLKERPEYRIYATGWWLENTAGEVIGDVDTYFHHVITGERCETAWTTHIGWCGYDERTEEMWETLSMRIQNIGNLEQIICDEESFEV